MNKRTLLDFIHIKVHDAELKTVVEICQLLSFVRVVIGEKPEGPGFLWGVGFVKERWLHRIVPLLEGICAFTTYVFFSLCITF